MKTVTPPSASAPERLLTAREVAEYVGSTPRKITEAARAGQLPKYLLPNSNRARFRLSEVLGAMTGRED
jgi:predicted DNA-binding transcriptional regulator AlpA